MSEVNLVEAEKRRQGWLLMEAINTASMACYEEVGVRPTDAWVGPGEWEALEAVAREMCTFRGDCGTTGEWILGLRVHRMLEAGVLVGVAVAPRKVPPLV